MNDYFQGHERSGPIITSKTITRLRAPPSTILSTPLESYLYTIPIGPEMLFDLYDTILQKSVAYHRSVVKLRWKSV